MISHGNGIKISIMSGISIINGIGNGIMSSIGRIVISICITTGITNSQLAAAQVTAICTNDKERGVTFLYCLLAGPASADLSFFTYS